MSIEVSIKKKFKDFCLDVDFSLDAKSLGILGASGCGKSMTLKCIAGIETPDFGYIVADGRVFFDSEKKINMPARERRVGYLFQNYALFPTMTVLKNVEAGIREKKPERRRYAEAWLGRMGLSGLFGRYPDELSGGQQQRAALARMLAAEPQMILLDEPFSALDTYLKDSLQREMKSVIESFGGHVIMVSHSRDELYRLCGHMAVMDEGRVRHMDSTRAVFDNPKYVQAARLTGCKNISEIVRIGVNEVYAEAWGLRLVTAEPVTEDISHIGIRAHHFRAAALDRAARKNKAAGVFFDGTQNVFPVVHEDTDESPFEIHYFMRNAAAPESKPIWWKVPKFSVNEANAGPMPYYLSVRPEDIMLLKSSDLCDKVTE